MKNRAFVKYKKNGDIVPGSLIITNGGYPDGGPYKEITIDLCCDESTNFSFSTKNKNRAFVKYTKSGEIVPGSLILTNGEYPKGGPYKEITINLCCNNVTYYNVAGCERMEYHVIRYNGPDELVEGTIVNNATPECWYIIDKTTGPEDVGVVTYVWETLGECTPCIYSHTTTTTTTLPPPFRMLFSNITEVSAIIGDASNVANWNTFFDLPNYGNPFTSVVIVGNEVQLIGGSNIIIKEDLFYSNDNLISIEDDSLCIVELQDYTFSNCTNLYKVILNNVIIAGNGCFETSSNITDLQLNSVESIGYDFFGDLYIIETISLPNVISIANFAIGRCYDLININLPMCENLGSTVGNNDVFFNITGNNITLTIPAALMTCNSGNPDGDIQYLQANNTVTIITV